VDLELLYRSFDFSAVQSRIIMEKVTICIKQSPCYRLLLCDISHSGAVGLHDMPKRKDRRSTAEPSDEIGHREGSPLCPFLLAVRVKLS
jgi:hypothetical protein